MSTVTAGPATGRSTSSRGWIAAGVGAAVVLVLASWLLVIGPTRSEAADVRLRTTDVETQNGVLAARVAELKEAAEQRPELADQLRTALEGLPPGSHLPVLSRQLADQAISRGVTLTGFSVGAAVDAAAMGGTDATGQPVAAAPVLAIPVTVTSTGSALDQLYFLRDLQQVGPRLALVSSTSVTPGEEAGDTGSIDASAMMTTQLTVFTRRLPSQTRDQIAELLGSETSN